MSLDLGTLTEPICKLIDTLAWSATAVHPIRYQGNATRTQLLDCRATWRYMYEVKGIRRWEHQWPEHSRRPSFPYREP